MKELTFTTKKEYKRLTKFGKVNFDRAAFISILKLIGYKIDKNKSFVGVEEDHVNPYKFYHVSFLECEAQIAVSKEAKEELMRKLCNRAIVFENGRIWEF